MYIPYADCVQTSGHVFAKLVIHFPTQCLLSKATFETSSEKLFSVI